jgi:hypothetical protein
VVEITEIWEEEVVVGRGARMVSVVMGFSVMVEVVEEEQRGESCSGCLMTVDSGSG